VDRHRELYFVTLFTGLTSYKLVCISLYGIERPGLFSARYVDERDTNEMTSLDTAYSNVHFAGT
jgi:hypothetical protein